MAQQKLLEGTLVKINNLTDKEFSTITKEIIKESSVNISHQGICSSKYKVKWSEEDREFVGTHSDYPSLSWLAKTEKEALEGIYKLVYDTYIEMTFPDDALLVMSKYQITEDSPNARGQRITVKEAKQKFGGHIINEIIDRGSALINLEDLEKDPNYIHKGDI